MRHSGSITRRSLFGAGALGAISLAETLKAAREPEIARGRVVEMTGGSRRGIPGVLVSNGVEVTSTNTYGAYALPMRDGVFVIKPAHWALPFDVRTGAPTFAYMHRPFGSPPGLAHGGMAPTGEMPDSIDFVLERQREPAAFTAALLADPQPANSTEVGFLSCVMDKMCARSNLAFALTLGDIASDNLAIYDSYQKQARRLGVPVWHIPGNHDHDADAHSPRFRLETWRAAFGPPTYAFEYAGALFIMLDNVEVQRGGYIGAIGPAGLAFVRNLLAFTSPERLVVVCTHIPLTSSHPDDPSCKTADANALLALLASRKAISFSGHMHTSEHHYLPTPSGAHHHQIITALSGSWWSGPFDASGHPLSVSSDGAPHGWHELSIDGNDYHTTFVGARGKALARVIASTPVDGVDPGALIETVNAHPVQGGFLLNVFDGGPRTRVYMDVSGARHELQRVHATDPYIEHLYREAGASLKDWVRPEPSTHLWMLDTSALPLDAAAAARLTIVDEFGRTRISETQLSLS